MKMISIMFINSGISSEYRIVNINHIAACGVFDDPNGNYFLINILLSNGQKISWKYDDKAKRDSKAAEIHSGK